MGMQPGTNWTLSKRVLYWRVIQKRLQWQVAEDAGISRKYLSMIENGHTVVVRRETVRRIAHALGVGIDCLIDQPTPPRSGPEFALLAVLPALRTAFDGLDSPPPVRSYEDIAADTESVLRARAAADLDTMARLLPGLVAELQDHPDGRTRALHVKVLFTVALGVKTYGHVDLARVYTERAQAIAADIDPVSRAAAGYLRAQLALSSGSRERSLSIALQAADYVQDCATPDQVDMYGMLTLHAALAAANLGRNDDAHAYLREARQVSGRAGSDAWNLDFGPENVATWAMAIAIDGDEAGRVPELARKVNVNGLRHKTRRARYWVDYARGLYANGDLEGPVPALQKAADISLSTVRRPAVTEIITFLARENYPTHNEPLAKLMQVTGVDPLAEMMATA